MSDHTLDLPPVDTDYAHWIGWLASLTREAIVNLDYRIDGERLFDDDFAIRQLRRGLEAFAQSGVATTLMPHLWDIIPAGWVVEDAHGEPQAMRDTFAEATAAVADVESHYDDAATCGHPDAPGWVARKRPFRVRQITRAERDEFEEFPPVIDREP